MGRPWTRPQTVGLAIAIAMLCVPLIALARPGGLDKTFGKDGVTITKVSATGAGASRVAVQDDGRIVVAGVSFFGSGEDTDADFMVAGYTPNGRLDRSFGNRGLVVFDFDQGYAWEYARDLALTADGKILVGGSTEVEDFASAAGVARLNPDGSFDSTLDGDGRLAANPEGLAVASSVLPLADGDFLVVGLAGKAVAVARFNFDGSLDSAWAGDGVATHHLGSGARVGRATLDGSGGVVVVVGSAATGSDGFGLVRFGTDGTFDTAFGAAGLAKAKGAGVTEIAPAPGGKLVAAGGRTIARFAADGSRDTSFAGDGTFAFSKARGFLARGLAVAPNGSLALAGTAGEKGRKHFAVAQLRSNGRLNRSFGAEGYSVQDLGGLEAALGIALQDNGRLVAAGRAGGRSIFIGGIGGGDTGIALARFRGR